MEKIDSPKQTSGLPKAAVSPSHHEAPTIRTYVSRPDSWLRGVVQGKTRILMAWIFAGLLALFARNYPALPGIVVCFTGATLRFWASGYLRKDSRPAVGGPYAQCRNPLYLGTYVMALGTAWAIQNYWLLGIVTILFAVVYHYIILEEETKLDQIFGAPYAVYCKLVPRFFPRPWPANKQALLEVNPDLNHHQHSWELSKKNKAFEAYASFFGLIGGVSLIAWVWQYFKA
ncbi:MAG: isoprenylcysteine carboxylmethyltransferase family protein [Methylotenera sp.]|nr:isoprenylcysteine carboxylmethyltransferase family protein [Oligoflexia bacterium]